MAEASKDAITNRFTPRELEILLKAHLCMKVDKDKPIVDSAKLNLMCGFNHHRAGYNSYYSAMKKVKNLWGSEEATNEGNKDKNAQVTTGENGNDSAPVTPKKATPRKHALPKALTIPVPAVENEAANDEIAGDEVEDAVDEIAIPETPGSAKRKASDAEGESASPETPMKKKRAPRKPKAPELDENGNPIPKPKRGRPKKSAETAGEENDASAPTTPATPTPKKRAATTGGRKKKADATNVNVNANANANANANEKGEPAGVPSSSPIASASSSTLQPYAIDAGTASDDAKDATVTIRNMAAQATAELDKNMPEDGEGETQGNIIDELSV